jgi:hypothetical protein
MRVFYVDGFKIARDEASDVELQFRMQGQSRSRVPSSSRLATS